MEFITLAFILAAIMFYSHGWHLLDRAGKGSTGATGLVSGLLLALAAFWVLFSGQPLLERETLAALFFLFLLALYGLLMAGLGLWGLEERHVGLYSLLAATGLIFYGAFFYGTFASQDTRFLLAALSLVMAVPFAFLFLTWGPPFPRLRRATGYLLLIGSLVIIVPAFMGLVGVVPL